MSEEHIPPPPPERRRFLKFLTHGLSAVFAAVLSFPAIAYLIDPRNRPERDKSFKRVGRLSDLTQHVPKQVVIRDVRRDAWTLHPNDVIGRVWLVWHGGKKVDAFTTICPHLGCSINYQESDILFVCPCHNGTFDLDGAKRQETTDGGNNPAPRGMDSLQYRLVPDGSGPDFFIEVEYQNFEKAIPEKKPKA